jgi:hypothetical protein
MQYITSNKIISNFLSEDPNSILNVTIFLKKSGTVAAQKSSFDDHTGWYNKIWNFDTKEWYNWVGSNGNNYYDVSACNEFETPGPNFPTPSINSHTF